MSVELRAIDYFRGDTDPINFRIRDSANAIVDITGRTYRLGIGRVRGPTAGEAANALVLSIAGTILDAAGGIVGFQPAAGAFDAMPVGDFRDGRASLFYDLEQTTAGVILTLGAGVFTLHQDISK